MATSRNPISSGRTSSRKSAYADIASSVTANWTIIAKQRHTLAGILLVVALSLLSSHSAYAQQDATVTGTWDGYWFWTSCPAFGCALGQHVDNIHMLLSADANTGLVTGPGFSNATGNIEGAIVGSTFSFSIDYGRSDVFGTCVLTLTGNKMTGPCIDHYTSGPGTWTLVATNLANPDLTMISVTSSPAYLHVGPPSRLGLVPYSRSLSLMPLTLRSALGQWWSGIDSGDSNILFVKCRQ